MKRLDRKEGVMMENTKEKWMEEERCHRRRRRDKKWRMEKRRGEKKKEEGKRERENEEGRTSERPLVESFLLWFLPSQRST